MSKQESNEPKERSPKDQLEGFIASRVAEGKMTEEEARRLRWIFLEFEVSSLKTAMKAVKEAIEGKW